MTDPDSTSPILLDIDSRGVAHVVLNRPEVNNAYDGGLIRALLDALDALERTKALRAAVIRGRAALPGGRRPEMDRGGAHRLARREHRGVAGDRRSDVAAQRAPVPTVALVQGGCFGGGTGIVAACDVVVAADNAMFSIAEVRWGITAAIIIPQLNDAIGVRQVRRYALTGERFGAEEARRIGLVHEVVPLAELERPARASSARSRERPGRPRRRPRRTPWLRLRGCRRRAASRTGRAAMPTSGAPPKRPKALASFAQKRAARWT